MLSYRLLKTSSDFLVGFNYEQFQFQLDVGCAFLLYSCMRQRRLELTTSSLDFEACVDSKAQTGLFRELHPIVMLVSYNYACVP